MDSPTPTEADEFWIRVVGRVLATEELMISLLASHARMIPDGVGRKMLADPEATIAALGRVNMGGRDLESGAVTEAKEMAIADYLARAQATIDAWREQYGPG